jgi:sarcosine oxidase, subunit beta
MATDAIPQLADRLVVRTWACYEGRSPDRLLMIGPLPSPKGFYVQCCAKGGFTLAPIIGLTMAEWLVNGKPSTPLDPYLVSRFMPYRVTTDQRSRSTPR